MPRNTSIFRLATGSRSRLLAYRPVRLALLVLCLAALAPATASASLTGGISGTVTDAVSHSPLAGIGVGVFDSSGNRVEVTTTDDNGSYTLDKLTTASYHVLFAEENHIGYLSQWYGGNDFAGSAPVVVQAPLTATGIDAVLQQTGAIDGSVSDASTGAAVVGAEVDVYDSSGNVLTYTCSGADGSYSVSDLAPGQYRVRFLAAPGIASLCHGANYIAAYYSAAATFLSAQLVSVTPGGTVDDVNGALAIGGQLTGTVTSATDHSALTGITVTAYDDLGNAVVSTCSAPGGVYDLIGLASGAYRVGFLDDGECAGAPAGYHTAFYAGPGSITSILSGAQASSVTAGQSIGNIDAALTGGRGGTTSTTTTSSSSTSSSSLSSTSTTSSSTTTSLIVPTTSSTSTTSTTSTASTTQSSSSTTRSDGGQTGGALPGSASGSGAGPRPVSGGSSAVGAPNPKPLPKAVLGPPRCTMKTTGSSVLLHAPKHLRRGAPKPSVGTITVNVTCAAAARLTLAAAVYEVSGGRHSKLAMFVASVRASAAVKRKLTLALHLSHSALAGLGRRATTSALLGLKVSGTGGTATSTLAISRLRGTG